MPNLKTHRAISQKRTGFDFAELHKWVDEPKKKLGFNHRQERHYLNDADMKTIKDRWGEKAIIEWLFHIAIDNLNTAFKLSSKHFSYGKKAFNSMEFEFYKSGFIHCNFKRIPENELKMLDLDETYYDDYNEDGFITGLLKEFFS
jgi:hypothetical protein